MQKQGFIVSSSPHVHSGYTISAAMRDVILALLPAVAASLYFFGHLALMVIAVCILSAVFFEYICQRLMNKQITITDGSAALTGLLLAMCLPPSLPLWMAAVGSFLAIVLGKQVFGGLGCNIFNPAHIGRAILLASFPAQMTTWIEPKTLDAMTSPTPLAQLKILPYWVEPQNIMIHESLPSLYDLFIGNVSGSIGETSALALFIGGIYLIWRGHIDWRIPVIYILSVFVLMFLYATIKGYAGLDYAFYQILAGGLIIGAFFMATDWVTGPLSKNGKIIFALGLGFLTCLIRLKSSYAEGVCYSILLMNMLVPFIDKYSRCLSFGRAKK